MESVDAPPTQSWPARFRAVGADGRIALTLPASAPSGLDHADAVLHFAARRALIGV